MCISPATICIILLTAHAATLSACIIFLDGNNKPNPEVAAIQGCWLPVYILERGKEIAIQDNDREAMSWLFSPGTLEFKVERATESKAKYTIDPRNRHLDFVFTSGPYKGRSHKAAYKFDKKLLHIIIDTSNKSQYPTVNKFDKDAIAKNKKLTYIIFSKSAAN